MPNLFTNVSLKATPVEKEHVVNKKYVDDAINRKIKDAVVVVCSTNIDSTYDSTAQTLTQTTPTEFVIDGVTLNVNDRVLVTGQTDATQNGIYTVTTLGVTSGDAGVLTRAEDFNSTEDLTLNLKVPVQKGTQNADTTWQMTNDTVPALDTDVITFAKSTNTDGVKSFTTTFVGDGATKEFTITHGLGTKNVVVSVRETATGKDAIFEAKPTTENVVTLKADVVLESTDSFDVVVMG